MAHPFYLIDDALRCFYRQWNLGLQPKLSLMTQPDGSIVISSEVNTQMPEYDHISSHAHSDSRSSRRRRSGRNSRNRRRYLRSKCHVTAGAFSNEVNLFGPVHTNETCGDALPVEVVPIDKEIVFNAASADNDTNLSMETEALDWEVRVKDEQIKKLEEEVSKLKIKLSYLHDYCANTYG